jgi:hypothetical protein
MVMTVLILAGHPGPVAEARQFRLDSAGISGKVVDAAGMPLAGAAVAVEVAGRIFRERLVLTDRSGAFVVAGLEAGEYSVSVTKSRFLPALAQSIELDVGVTAVLTVSLQTALDVVVDSVRRGRLEDVKWVLRTSPTARPVLHLAPSASSTDTRARNEVSVGESSSAGYLQLYSTSAGSGATPESVGSEFEYRMTLGADSALVVAGRYSEAVHMPRGFAASYGFSMGGDRRALVGVRTRQAAYPGIAGDAGELQFAYEEAVQWNDQTVFRYGASVGRPERRSGATTYFRPEFGVSWLGSGRTKVQAAFSRRDPADSSDPIRGREYFDYAVQLPAELERYGHSEVGLEHRIGGNVRASIDGFRDTQGVAAFFADNGGGEPRIVLVDSGALPTTGVRLFVDRVEGNVEAGVGYTWAHGPVLAAMAPGPGSTERFGVEPRPMHMLTARLGARFDRTRTDLTAVYRWVNQMGAGAVDPYQQRVEYNDPSLSITVAQDLPSPGLFPARIRAIVDARNLFEPGFGDGGAVPAVYRRLVKGGIHIQF